MAKPTVEVYRADRVSYIGSDRHEWRWRLRAANGEIVASGEGHTKKADAIRAAMSVLEIAESGECEFRTIDPDEAQST